MCNDKIPSRVIINGVYKAICGRKFCLNCSPWGSNNRKDLTISEEERELKRKQQENERSKRYYKKNPLKQKNKRREQKEKLTKLFGGKCQRCGYSKCLSALIFHHRNPEEKTFHLSYAGWTIKWDRILEEAKKCDLLCSNCHFEIHEELKMS